MEEIRKQQIKENSFEAEWTLHLYELPRFHWSFYVFKWSSRSARNCVWKRYRFSVEESKKDLCSSKLPESKLDNVFRVFDQLK